MKALSTSFTKMLGISYPIIAAPMFLVSNEDIVVEASEAGGIGTFPALNYRPIEKYREALKATNLFLGMLFFDKSVTF